MGPVRDLTKNIQNISEKELRPISLQDFKIALTQIRPSVSPDSLKAYQTWNKEFGTVSL